MATILGMVLVLARYEVPESSVARLLMNGGMIEVVAGVVCTQLHSDAPG
jgi:hypothetical protein